MEATHHSGGQAYGAAGWCFVTFFILSFRYRVLAFSDMVIRTKIGKKNNLIDPDTAKYYSFGFNF